MKKILTIIVGLLVVSQTAFAGFSDVPTSHRYAGDIEYLQQLGIVQEEIFRPNEPITRAVFAQWLLKNAGFRGEGYQPRTKRRFFDVSLKDNPYAPSIYRLIELGAVNLRSIKNNNFKPDATISRMTALEWIFFVEGIAVPRLIDKDSYQATDVSLSSKNAPLFHKAIQLGILQPGRARPNKRVTRAEAAHFLRLAKNTVPMLTITIVPSVDSDLSSAPKYDLMLAVWNRLYQNYLRKESLDKDALIYGAIEGIVKEIGDKHSEFERPGDNATLDSLSGQIEGIGAVLQMKDDEVVIVTPINGSPAERAGLLPNDIITHVDDISIRGLTLSEVANKIKGKRGTSVKLSIERGLQTLSFSIVREVVKIVSVSFTRTGRNVAQIKLSSFGDNTTSEFAAIVKELKQSRPAGIVLDLRNNPGGFLTTAIQIGGYFIRSGETIATIRYPSRTEEQQSGGSADLAGIPLVVIINAGSASASEILAGALQDYGLAKIIGEKSFGKGTVQELSDFTDGSTLKLTVAEWLTPDGKLIDNFGITPDIEVKMTDEDRKAGRDPQMDRALEEVLK